MVEAIKDESPEGGDSLQKTSSLKKAMGQALGGNDSSPKAEISEQDFKSLTPRDCNFGSYLDELSSPQWRMDTMENGGMAAHLISDSRKETSGFKRDLVYE